MTFSDSTAHSSPLFYDLKILKLDDLHQLSISVFVYECQNNTAMFYFINCSLKVLMDTLTTPEALLVETFYLTKNTLQYGLCFFCFNGAKIWNSIPPEIRDAPSV